MAVAEAQRLRGGVRTERRDHVGSHALELAGNRYGLFLLVQLGFLQLLLHVDDQRHLTVLRLAADSSLSDADPDDVGVGVELAARPLKQFGGRQLTGDLVLLRDCLCRVLGGHMSLLSGGRHADVWSDEMKAGHVVGECLALSPMVRLPPDLRRPAASPALPGVPDLSGLLGIHPAFRLAKVDIRPNSSRLV